VREEAPAPRGRQRRPPLAEVDTAELLQAWRSGDRGRVRPWLGLLASFCVVLAAMYSFFFFSVTLTDDVLAGVVMSFVFLVLLVWLGRRVAGDTGLALAVIGFMVAVSGGAFLLWLLWCALTGFDAFMGILGTVVLGLLGAFVAVPALNKIEKQRAAGGERDTP
jgi:hypothetical protein